jgi:hypothetical protein
MSAAAGMVVTEMNTPMRTVIYVEEDGVAGWPRGALEHDQVSDAGEVREPVEQPPGETRRGDDADVQH